MLKGAPSDKNTNEDLKVTKQEEILIETRAEKQHLNPAVDVLKNSIRTAVVQLCSSKIIMQLLFKTNCLQTQR